ncbi:MAG TPA: YbdD/YjiX family protein [Gemmatimonadaceae bacterium]|nr:YbdD/YjiX family protein [Gemmatimonadaceae bacterium]
MKASKGRRADGPKGLRAGAEDVLRVVRRIVGVPDYEAYVAHVRAHHPDEEPLSQSAFIEKCWDEKYSRPGTRCC